MLRLRNSAQTRRPPASSPSPTRRSALILCSLLLATPQLLAFTHDCSIARTPTACQLDAVLHFLYVFALVLAALLVLVLVVAVLIYRRNRDLRSSLTP